MTLVIVALLLAGGLNVFGAVIVFSGWKTMKGAPQFVLAMLPLALTFLVAPAPAIVVQLIRDFRDFGRIGANGPALLANSSRAFLFGGAGFVSALAVAGALQWHAGWTDADDVADEGGATRRVPSVHGWRALALTCSPIVALIVAPYASFAEGVPVRIMGALVAARGAGLTPDQFRSESRVIAAWLSLAFMGGIVEVVLIAVVGMMTLMLVRSHRFSPRIGAYSWVVLAVVALGGVWNVYALMRDFDWIAANAGLR